MIGEEREWASRTFVERPVEREITEKLQKRKGQRNIYEKRRLRSGIHIWKDFYEALIKSFPDQRL